MYTLVGGLRVAIKELKQELLTLLAREIGVEMYAVLKMDDEDELRMLNIADEQTVACNTADELCKGFAAAIKQKIAEYDEDDIVLKLSSADDRKNGLYFYDLDETPKEMQYMKRIIEKKEDIGTFNFKKDKLNTIVAILIVAGDAENKIVLYKRQYPVGLLSRDRYMLTPIRHENRFKKVDEDILRVDFNFQFFLWKNVVYIVDIDKMEKICSFHYIIKNEARKSVQKIEDAGILDNAEVLLDEIDNISFARKLTRVYKDSKVLGRVPNSRIISFTKEHSFFEKNPLKINDSEDKFILDTKKSKNTFIKLLNDNFLTSELTNYDYEALAKNNI